MFLQPCAGVSISMTMPEGVVVFEDNTMRGLEGGGHSLTIHEGGMLEYDSGMAEYSLVLPQDVADELYAAFEGLGGEPLDDGIEAGEEENPPVVAPPIPAPVGDAGINANDDGGQGPARGGRNRRSRLKKQTRRTKRKSRKTIRKKL